jgi:4a-hydroxytetrahydrobiopterin dehydratase
MSRAALVAEKLDHHPEWSNVYDRVAVDLVTHDAKGITELDFALAERMNELAGPASS